MLRLLTPLGSHGGLSTLLSEQLPTQGTSVHREMGAGTLVEALANGGASSNANMAHPRRPGCTQKLSARAVGGVKAGYPEGAMKGGALMSGAMKGGALKGGGLKAGYVERLR
jgi:hypothetical protein